MQGQRIRKRDKTRCDLDVLIFLYARSAFLAPLSLCHATPGEGRSIPRRQLFDKSLEKIVRLESNMCRLHSCSFEIALYVRKLQL